MDGVQGYSSHSDNEGSGIKPPRNKPKERDSSGDESPHSRDKSTSRRKKSLSRSPERNRKSDHRHKVSSSKSHRSDRRSSRHSKSRSRSRSPPRRRRHSKSKSRSRSRSPPRRRRRSRSRERRHRRSRSRSPRRRDDRRRSRSRSRTPPWSSQRGSRSGVTRAVLPSSKDTSQNGLGLKKRVLTTEEVEQKLAAHMVTMQKKATEEAKNANLPSYLNPAMVNARQFKQQQEKKKLLWSSKKSQDPAEATTSQWNAGALGSSTFGDEATAEKYKRLMGIKGNIDPSLDHSKEILDNLEKEYEKSRAFQLSRGAGGTTGIGLGFGSMDKS